MLSTLDFIFLILASFRLTRLIVYDTITNFVRKPFHEIVEEEYPDGSVQRFLKIRGTGVRYWIGELLSCYWCTGIWSSAFLYVGYIALPLVFKPIALILAIAGCAAILETWVGKQLL